MTMKNTAVLSIDSAIALAIAFFGVRSVAATNSVDLHVRRHQTRAELLESRTELELRPATLNLRAGTFQQVVDHTSLTPSATFSQRYWINSQYASGPDAPVLLRICGEADAEYFLDDNADAWAKALGARVVYLEHRYYGKSLPFADFSTDHLKFLTLNNAIEDLASFQKAIAASSGWTGKWISVGGSYSGTLSAIYRLKHPDLVVGALAASAPMISGVGDSVDDQTDLDYLLDDDSEDRPWAYQACTELGFWEADGPTPSASLQIPSASLCQSVFAHSPAVVFDTYNQNYDEPFLSGLTGAPTNILFTYGDNDIWTKLGLSGQVNANTSIQILTIKGAGHHFDLNAPGASDSFAVVAARGTFLDNAKKWLSVSAAAKP